jgi:hypothetical protein
MIKKMEVKSNPVQFHNYSFALFYKHILHIKC